MIIGRNADYILKDRDDVLHVFIHGDMQEKIQRITGLYNVDVYKRQLLLCEMIPSSCSAL